MNVLYVARQYASQVVLFLFAVILASLFPVSVKLSQRVVNGTKSYDYAPSGVPFLAELMKMLISLGMWYKTIYQPYAERKIRSAHNEADATPLMSNTDDGDDDIGSVFPTKSSVILLSVPGLVFALNNVAIWGALQFISSPEFQFLGNLKILTTAVIFAVVMKRKQSFMQCCGLLLLTLATMLVVFPSDVRPTDALRDAAAEDDGSEYRKTIGIVMVLITCCLSGVGNVFSEYCYKHGIRKQSLWLQNIQLYSYGVVINFSLLLWKTGGDVGGGLFPIFWNAYALLAMMSMGFYGLLIGFILRYLSNIFRIFSAAAATICVASLNALMSSGSAEPLPQYFFLAVLLLFVAVAVYNFDLLVGRKPDHTKG